MMMTEKKAFSDLFIASVALSFLTIVPPLIVMSIIDKVITHHSFSTLFLMSVILILKGGPVVGPTLSLLGQYLPGYEVSPRGSLVGLAYGALLYRTGFRMAARWIRANQPELFPSSILLGPIGNSTVPLFRKSNARCPQVFPYSTRLVGSCQPLSCALLPRFLLHVNVPWELNPRVGRNVYWVCRPW